MDSLMKNILFALKHLRPEYDNYNIETFDYEVVRANSNRIMIIERDVRDDERNLYTLTLEQLTFE
jgi:hypothetical protein